MVSVLKTLYLLDSIVFVTLHQAQLPVPAGLPGEYAITVNQDGYEMQTKKITVSGSTYPMNLDFNLKKLQ